MSIYSTKYQLSDVEIAVFKIPEDEIKEELVKPDNSGFYSGFHYHRLELSFVIQGSSPCSAGFYADGSKNRKSGVKKCGTGVPGYTIKEEFLVNSNNSHENGALAMARRKSPNSAVFQYYLWQDHVHFLGPIYTFFVKRFSLIQSRLKRQSQLSSSAIKSLALKYSRKGLS
ncbi:MAG: peptidylprolyl isomerase [Eggerthellaceae bacterium]|nr:peptidylprolyl isomerase [Eggerthellaceae bacterium]